MYRSLCIALVLFVVSESTVMGDEATNESRLIEECRQGVNISKEDIKSLLYKGFPLEMTDSAQQCFIACYLRKLEKVLNADGTVNLAWINGMVKELENRDEMIEEYKKCAVLPTEGCENQYKIGACLLRVMQRHEQQGESRKE